MNMAQAVISLGFGCYAWKGVVTAPGALKKTFEQIHAGEWKPTSEHAELIEKMLAVLRAAGKSGQRLSRKQICTKLGVPPHMARMARRLLKWLCDSGAANRDGSRCGAVYWAE